MVSSSDDLFNEPEDYVLKVMLYTLGIIDELHERGVVSGGTRLTPGGRSSYLELKASGFKPTHGQLSFVVNFLKQEGEAPDVTDLGRMVQECATS